MDITLLRTRGWDQYELLDSGDGRKLERYGGHTFIRPEPQAMWKPRQPGALWDQADAAFQGPAEETTEATGLKGWSFRSGRPLPRWQLGYGAVRVWAEPTPFRHVGLFPEHHLHWDWVVERIAAHQDEAPFTMLNLFAYTGFFSLMAAAAGAHVTHLDASRKTLTWARQNQQLSHLEDRPIRWLEDDATKFVEREIRRGRKYDGIILDPPKYGRGPNGEVWKIYESLPTLLQGCAALLSDRAQFVILTTYAVRISPLSLHHLLSEALNRPGCYECGELVVQEKASEGRELSTSSFARWSPEPSIG
jgi:23S rRNA (cytosine1962-C5)-methyltransferase